MVFESDDVVSGGIAALIGIFMTIMLFYIVAIPSEAMMTAFEDGTAFNVDVHWESYDGATTMMSIMYMSMCTPALAGIGVLFLTILKRQRRDVEYVEAYQ